MATSPGATSGAEVFADCQARIDARPDRWTGYYCFVNTSRSTGQWADAVALVTAQQARAPEPRRPFWVATLGFLELNRGRLSTAASHFRAAAEAFATRGDAENEALAWMNLATCHTLQGQLDTAGEVLQQAEAAARAAGDQQKLIRILVQKTDLVVLQGGDLAQADHALRAVEDELADDTPYLTWHSLLYMRASLAHRLGRYREARRINERWAERAREADRPGDEALALANQAVNVVTDVSLPGARETGLQLAYKTLEVAEESGNQAASATAHRLLGVLLPADQGRDHLEACHRLTAATENTRDQALCLFSLAGSLAEDDPDEARLVLDQALALSLASENLWTVAYGWAERFRVGWATRPRDEAASDSLGVLGHIESLRRLQDSEAGRAGFFADWVEAYHALAGYLLDASDGPTREELETAFFVSERLRARVLLDSLAAARVESPALADETIAEERTSTLREIVRIQRLLQNPDLEEPERPALLDELERLERDLAGLEDRLQVSGSLPEIGFVTLSELEGTLASNQAVFTFLVAPDEDVYGKFAGGSWLLAVTNSGTRAYRLPGRRQVETKVAMFQGLVEGRDDTSLDPGAATLYDDLVGTALADLSARVDELILVPDGILHLLPFGLLRPHPQVDPLAASHRLSWAPSATLWHRWRTDPATAPAAALALADPAFVGAANPADPSTEKLAAEDRQWALETGGLLGRLPHAVKEGRALVRRLGGAPSQVRIGDEASEAFLKSASLDGFGVLHFAAHALVDDQRPRRSAVLLAAGSPEEDGLLQPREIAALDLTGKLVVVSACESGSGQVLLGEGLQSLARAFFRAGARAVVASLWRLEDEEAADFFERFYRALATGASVAGAVAEAQGDLRREGAPAAAWAGVVVLGDGGMVPVPGGVKASIRWWIPVGLVVFGLVVAILVRAGLRMRGVPSPAGSDSSDQVR